MVEARRDKRGRKRNQLGRVNGKEGRSERHFGC